MTIPTAFSLECGLIKVYAGHELVCQVPDSGPARVCVTRAIIRSCRRMHDDQLASLAPYYRALEGGDSRHAM